MFMSNRIERDCLQCSRADIPGIVVEVLLTPHEAASWTRHDRSQVSDVMVVLRELTLPVRKVFGICSDQLDAGRSAKPALQHETILHPCACRRRLSEPDHCLAEFLPSTACDSIPQEINLPPPRGQLSVLNYAYLKQAAERCQSSKQAGGITLDKLPLCGLKHAPVVRDSFIAPADVYVMMPWPCEKLQNVQELLVGQHEAQPSVARTISWRVPTFQRSRRSTSQQRLDAPQLGVHARQILSHFNCVSCFTR